MMGWFELILTNLSASTWIAPVAAFFWGTASVLLSPCHVTSVPLLATFLARNKEQESSVWELSLYITIGMSLSLFLVAGITIAAGRIVGDLWGLGPWFAAGLLALAALHLFGVLDIPTFGSLRHDRVRPTRIGAFIAGSILGTTLGPCTFAFVAPVLVLVTQKSAGTIAWLSFVTFSLAHLGFTYFIGGFGVRIGQWLKSGSRFSAHFKMMAGIVSLLLAIQTIMNIP